MKELLASIMLLFSSGDVPKDIKYLDETPKIMTLKEEIKNLQREIEYIEVTKYDPKDKWDPADKYFKIGKIKENLAIKSRELKLLENKQKLRQKWAKEDSVEVIKRYPELIENNEIKKLESI
jgi:hypothetical protein